TGGVVPRLAGAAEGEGPLTCLLQGVVEERFEERASRQENEENDGSEPHEGTPGGWAEGRNTVPGPGQCDGSGGESGNGVSASLRWQQRGSKSWSGLSVGRQTRVGTARRPHRRTPVPGKQS